MFPEKPTKRREGQVVNHSHGTSHPPMTIITPSYDGIVEPGGVLPRALTTLQDHSSQMRYSLCVLARRFCRKRKVLAALCSRPYTLPVIKV